MMTDPGRMDWTRLVPLGILLAVVGALGTAYAAEHGLGIEPCILCLYQRLPYALAGVLAILVLLLPRGPLQVWAVAGCGFAFLAGAGIAFYHVGVEQHWWASAACGAAGGGAEPTTVEELRAMLKAPPGKACDDLDWTLFGVSMATYNVFASLGLAVGAFWGAEQMRRMP